MKKRQIAVLLCFAVLLTLTGCGTKQTDQNNAVSSDELQDVKEQESDTHADASESETDSKTDPKLPLMRI